METILNGEVNGSGAQRSAGLFPTSAEAGDAVPLWRRREPTRATPATDAAERRESSVARQRRQAPPRAEPPPQSEFSSRAERVPFLVL